MVGADRQLRGEQSMPVRTRRRGAPSRRAARAGPGTRAPGRAHGTRSPGAMLRTPHDDLLLAGAVVDAGEAELVGVRDGRGPRAPAPRPRPRRPAHGRSTTLDLHARAREQLGELVGRRGRSGRTRGATRATTFTRRPRTAPGTGRRRRRACRMSGIPYAQQRHAVDAHAEREPRVALAVVPAVLAGPSGAPCPRPAARSTRCRRCGSRRRRTRSTTRRPRAPGSTNGKNAGPRRTRRSSPNSAFAKASSVPFRSANVMPSSTASPSTWWNTGECVASAVSRRYTRPGATTYTGGGCDCIVRIWTARGLGAQQQLRVAGDVDVERVLHRARAGGPAGC